MAVNVTDSYVAEKTLDYAKLSELAYAEWLSWDGLWFLDPTQSNLQYYENLWNKMSAKGNWVFGYDESSETGYSGTIFEAYDGTKILANRGTEKWTDSRDRYADQLIAFHQVPAEQFRSMAEFINLTIGNDTFEVTGHSLGGCLAQVAKSAYAAQVRAVYTYEALGALTLVPQSSYAYYTESATPGRIILTDGVSYYEWDTSVWNMYRSLNLQQTESSKIFNVSGTSDILAEVGGPDIGREIFIDGTHGIKGVISNLVEGPFYVDPRKPETVIGSSRNEIFYGNYDSRHFSGSTVGNITLVGGYGNDELWGDVGNDSLYGDLPIELNNEAAKRATGNLTGEPGRDRLIGGKGND